MSHVTKCHSMKPSLPPLGDLEHELLTILWAQGEMTALAVRKHVARKLKDPTIRTVLRRLEEKGYVTHAVMSGTFIYRAKDPLKPLQQAPCRVLSSGSVVDRLSARCWALLMQDSSIQTSLQCSPASSNENQAESGGMLWTWPHPNSSSPPRQSDEWIGRFITDHGRRGVGP